MSGPSRGRDDGGDVQGLGWIAAGVVGFALVAWTIPQAVMLVAGGRAHLGVVTATAAAGRLVLDGHWGDPALAYPAAVRDAMPGPVVWWLTAGCVAGLWTLLVVLLFRHLEPLVARERLGRRPYDWHGARPRPWARPRDLGVHLRSGQGFSLGRLDGRELTAEEETHAIVVAPTRAGKTTRLVIPWLLEHEGPAIVTSTKRDILEASARVRGDARIWIYDPFGEDSMSWSPLHGCRDWSSALRQAQWLADATAEGDSEIARYWRGEAAKLLAPLLHAAALADEDVTRVLSWIDEQDVATPATRLLAEDAVEAERQLQAVNKLDDRNRGTTYMSAGSVLSAYRYPEVRERAGEVFTAGKFLLSGRETLFVIAAERHQRLLAPLVVTLLSSLIHEAIESGTYSGERRLRVLLDEAANIAPIRDLPRLLSQAAGHGIRMATVWQSVAQIEERHGRAAATIMANSTNKLFLGPVTDDVTRKFLISLLGDEAGVDGPRRRAVPKARSAALQQLSGDRALLIVGDRPPAVVGLRPYWLAR